jgi:hypothetical protein
MSRDGEPVYSCFFQQSSFASFAVAPAKDVVKIRRDAPIEMLGPLGCGLQTGAGAVLNVMQPAAGQSIAVYGVGGVGLAGLMAARPQAAIRSSPLIGSPLGWYSPANSVPRIRSKAAAPRRLPKSARSPAAGPISHWRRLPYRLCFGLPSTGCEVSAPASWLAAPVPAPRSA